MSSQQLWTPFTGPWQPALPVKAMPRAITADTTLVVVDMQIDYFSMLTKEAFDLTFAGVLREIDAAMTVGAPVIILEYYGSGPTHPDIMDRLKGYKGCDTPEPVMKNGWSGGNEVMQSCKDRGYSTNRFRLGGIFADHCVASTAFTLTGYEGVEVQVVVDACCHNVSRYDWTRYKNRPSNLKLVRHRRAAQPARLAA